MGSYTIFTLGSLIVIVIYFIVSSKNKNKIKTKYYSLKARPISTRDALLARLPVAHVAARAPAASHARRRVVTLDAREAWTVRLAGLAHRLWSLLAAGTVLDEAAQMRDFVALMSDIFAQLLDQHDQLLHGAHEVL